MVKKPFSACFGLVAGGTSTSGKSTIFYDTIEKYTLKIPGTHNATFGSLTATRSQTAAVASQKKGGRYVVLGGINSSFARVDLIDYMEVRSGGASSSFGVLTAVKSQMGSGSDCATGLVSGGYNSGGTPLTAIEKVQISVPANSTAYGDLVNALAQVGGYSDLKNLYTVCGIAQPTDLTTENVVQVKCIKSSGNAKLFSSAWAGTTSRRSPGFACNARVGIKAGGGTGNGTTVVEAMCLRSMAQGKSYATLSGTTYDQASVSSQERAMFIKGYSSSELNRVDYIDYKAMNVVSLFGSLGQAKGAVGGYGAS